MSESWSERFETKVGDVIELVGRKVRVVAMNAEYGNERGSLKLDEATQRMHIADIDIGASPPSGPPCNPRCARRSQDNEAAGNPDTFHTPMAHKGDPPPSRLPHEFASAKIKPIAVRRKRGMARLHSGLFAYGSKPSVAPGHASPNTFLTGSVPLIPIAV